MEYAFFSFNFRPDVVRFLKEAHDKGCSLAGITEDNGVIVVYVSGEQEQLHVLRQSYTKKNY